MNGNGLVQFPCSFAEGEMGGTSGMRSYISVHGATTKYFSNSFVFKNEIEKEGLPEEVFYDLDRAVMETQAKA